VASVCGVAWLVLGPLHAQPERPGTPRAYEQYGPPEAVDLSEVAYNSESYQRRRVLTRGELRALGGLLDKFLLVDGTARLLVIPVPELVDAPRRLVGQRVEVTGIVRSLPTSQPTVLCRGTMMLETKCADPDLPALPNAQVMRWIEVTGRVEVKDGVSTLRASKVMLVSAPRSPDP
jgi:hypothetical protein